MMKTSKLWRTCPPNSSSAHSWAITFSTLASTNKYGRLFPNWGWTWTHSCGKSLSQGSATAGWAGSRPATWIRWRPFVSRRSATGSATSLECSARKSGMADKWLAFGNPWEICRPEIFYRVLGGGHTEQYRDEHGSLRVRWLPAHVVKGVAYDTPVAGYGEAIVDFLRLWKSEAVESFDLQAFNVGDYYKAVDEKVLSETISKVLYPNDEPEVGKKLRLAQQYFFTSCSLQDMIRIQFIRVKNLDTFHENFAVQLNDTHPSIAVAELMRLFVDEHRMDWEKAWDITQSMRCSSTK